MIGLLRKYPDGAWSGPTACPPTPHPYYTTPFTEIATTPAQDCIKVEKKHILQREIPNHKSQITNKFQTTMTEITNKNFREGS